LLNSGESAKGGQAQGLLASRLRRASRRACPPLAGSPLQKLQGFVDIRIGSYATPRIRHFSFYDQSTNSLITPFGFGTEGA